MTVRAACLAGLLTLAACAVPDQTGFRNPDAPLAATSRFEPSAFAGDWRIVARFGSPRAGTLAVGHDPRARRITVSGASFDAISGVYREGVPGQLISERTDQSDLVVMWVDDDFETAAIGTANGGFGALIDRDGVVPADRARAAREVLRFYGWDIGALKAVAG